MTTTNTTSDFPVAFNRAFQAIDKMSGGMNYVLLSELRQALHGYSREGFDSGLNSLRDAKEYSLDSADGRHVRLSHDQLAGGITEGGSLLVYVAKRDSY